MCFLNPSHRSSHHKTHTHTRYHTSVSYNIADAASAVTAFASRGKSAWRTPRSAGQQRVSHDGSSVRYGCHFTNNGYACCSSGGFRLSPTPPIRLNEGSSRAKHRAANRFWTAIQLYFLTSTAFRKSTKTIKSTRLTIRRRIRRIQSKKSPVEKGRFQLAESDCVRNGRIILNPNGSYIPVQDGERRGSDAAHSRKREDMWLTDRRPRKRQLRSHSSAAQMDVPRTHVVVCWCGCAAVLKIVLSACWLCSCLCS